ncbi:hypothetical protein DRW03_31710 [Corallococcus sp. H22C18031201]|nr:hypothetical protein DRW03_31710 [Corallococcus sp. H22C18031201]
MAPEWRQWLVENLLRGTAPEDLVAELMGAGVPEARAREAVAVEQAEPHLQGALRAVQRQRKLEGLLDVYADLHRQGASPAQVARHASLSPEAFFARYYFQNLPVVLGPEAWAGGPSASAWAVEQVAELLGSDAVCLPLFEAARLASLRDTLTLPRGYVADPARASEPKLWWTPGGAEAPLRVSRHNLLLGQVQGRIEISLVPAFEWMRVQGADPEGRAPFRLEVALAPGELLLIPVGWWYALHAPEACVGISFEGFATPARNVRWADLDGEPELTPFPG